MNSPPQQAEHVAHRQSLTPESPRPQNVPSPSNIPILEQQMDPSFHEPSQQHNGTSTPASQFAQQATPYNANAAYQNIGVQGAEDFAMGGFAQSAFGSSTGAQAQDNSSSSIQNFAAQQHARPASTSDATQPLGQHVHPAYPYAHSNAYAAPQSAPGTLFQTEGQPSTSVDVQALLDSLTPAAHNATQSAHLHPNASASSLSSSANLPPRPPAQNAAHQGYNASEFHPHNTQAAAVQQRAGNAPPTPQNSRAAQSPTAPGISQQASRSETPDDEDIRWPPEINRKYEAFLDQERKFVTEGQWDQFPMGSRLFIGNLPTEKVTKRDIFHRFYRHGALAQISIKQAYGFVQFLDSESCRRALDAEQGQAVRGRKMHLEVSKPQKNSRKAEPQAPPPRRRSRSPDYSRGGTVPGPRDGRYGGIPGPMSPRERDRRFRDRDDYRPRSPSPRGPPRGRRSRDRSRDRYDGRYRSRSRTPPRRRRSPSPRQDYTEDGLDLRRRLPHEVPDIQILVLNESLSRDFIRYVEDTFRRQNLRSNVLVMSGRFPEPAVVRRQILEGVLAIVRLDTSGCAKGKVGVQIFDRRGGANNVQFNEYADLDPATAALLVNQAKQNQAQPLQPAHAQPFSFNRNMPAFNQPPGQSPFAAAPPNNISNIITQLDSNSLSQLLGAMGGNSIPQNPQPAPALNADIARLLAQVSSPVTTPGFGAPTQPQLSQLNQFPGLASLFANQAQSAPPAQAQNTTQSAAPDMSEIMAQLAQYQRG